MGGTTSSPVRRLRDYDPKTESTVYLADSDGFVSAYCNESKEKWGYCGSNADVVAKNATALKCAQTLYGTSLEPSMFLMPVKKGDYWQVTTDALTYKLFWIPFA